jgi:hypothetical protein
MITDKLIIEADRLEISCKTPRISDEQKTCDMSDKWTTSYVVGKSDSKKRGMK